MYLGGLGVIVLTSVVVPYLEPFLPSGLRSKELILRPLQLSNAPVEPLVLTVPEVMVGAISAVFVAW